MSYQSIKISTWGIKIDLQGLLFLAAVTAMAFVINTMVFPVAPSIWMKFGGAVSSFVADCCGPIWSGLASMISVAYVGILIHGDVFGIFTAGATGAMISFFGKWIPPLANAGVSSPLSGIISIWQQIYLTGAPVPLAVQIFLKRIANGVINSIIYTLLYSIPGIYNYLPMYYDSWVARYWLAKMEEDEEKEK